LQTIGIIGAGNIGSQVARLAIAANYNVVISNSRGPETLAKLVADLGPKARAATSVDAAKAGDLVVVAVPLKNYRSVPVAPLQGKIVIDANNYYPQRDGHIAELDSESTTTSELLQAHLPASKVVKAFNHIHAAELTTDGKPAGTKNRRALVIAGDDQDAKTVVTKLLDEFWLRHRGRRTARGGLAHPTRYPRVRSTTYGAAAPTGSGRSQAVLCEQGIIYREVTGTAAARSASFNRLAAP
jgi:predicted dinucleotide-binding enzyme